MAASLSLTQSQLSSGNPVYDKFYRQVDPSGSGRVGANDAASFLKRSGLSDLVLGKIWDLADSERKGFLNKQQFFVALRLVACAQNGLDVGLKSLSATVPPPQFDTSSPLLAGSVSADGPWVVKSEEKMKFDAIFESLSPVAGMLTGDKVKPVLLNSKLPVDVLGRVWELSDIDRDGMLDKDEFAVAMYLVYRALENEPVPMTLPPSLVPPSKRKKMTPPPVMPLLPSPPSLKERASSQSGSKTLPAKPTQPQWVVSPADKAKYDELFAKTDSDMDGLVSGPEVRDIFLKTGLPSATLARIWELCDIGDIGKLTREQFALALHLINQKLSKGIDPPQVLSPEMIPPSDRLARANSVASCQAADFSAIKELDSLSNEIMDLQREKSSVEQEIKEKEESIRERTSEVQELQDEVQKESEELQKLQAERQEVQEVLERLEEQKTSLEEQLRLIRQQCSQESQLLQSLQVEHSEQEQRIESYEEELVRAREELLRLQEETRVLGEKVQSARAQLCPLQDAVTESHTQITQVQEHLVELKIEEREVTAQLTWKVLEEEPPALVNGAPPPAVRTHPPQWPQSVTQLPAVLKGEEEEDEEDPAFADEPQELKVTEEQPDAEASQRPSSPKDLQPSAEAPVDQQTSTEPPAFSSSTPWPLDHMESSSSTPAMEPEMKTAEIKQPSTSTMKVESPGLEKKEETPPPPAVRSGSPPANDFFQSDPFTDSDPFRDDDLFSRVDVSDPFGGDPFKGTDPFATDSFFKQSSSSAFPAGDPFASSDPFGSSGKGPGEPDLFASRPNNTGESDPFSSRAATAVAADPFSSASGNTAFTSKTDALADSDPFSSAAGAEDDPFGGSTLSEKDTPPPPAAANDPFAPGGTTVTTDSDPDPFATVFGSESFGGGFADFSSLTKSNGGDPFTSNAHNKNLFREDNQSDVPPALPPKTGTPTRPPPPPPGKRSNIYRSDSSDSCQRRGLFGPQGSGEFSSLPAKDAVPDPFAPSGPCQAPRDPDRFASFDKYPTEEDMIEWAKRESEREERERVARLTQQEQEDLELAIALSKSELS
ncbi:epidermal growth factor receptor substrate 15 isoform X2 [Brachyhypopomus gauderio]|uniref:epidermal growth factor receptor substrate 15 isoform X2 n=1 Tax=Brachyhypopomus gauderio TaxID=698409 RepID=UPI0040424DD5